MVLVFRQQQPSARRNVIARKLREFLVKILKAQAEPERLCVLEKEFAGLCHLRCRHSLQELD
jgi:hypothetical protein